MPIISAENDLVLFVHIPKTGGTTIEKVFGGNVLHSVSIMESSLTVNAQHLDKFDIDMLGLRKLAPRSFTVVRNPYDRIESEYFHFHRDRKTRLSFRAFLVYVRFRKNLNPWVFDNHIRPQSDFVFESTKIYYFERGFSEITKSISAEFGLPVIVALKRFNQAREKWQILKSTGCVRIINEMYQTDFDRFHYPQLEANSTIFNKLQDLIYLPEIIIKIMIEKIYCLFILKNKT